MDDLNPIERLAAVARGDSPPAVDVAPRVIAALRERAVADQGASYLEKPFFVFGAASVACAVIMVIVALQTGTAQPDPLADMFTSLAMVMQ